MGANITRHSLDVVPLLEFTLETVEVTDWFAYRFVHAQTQCLNSSADVHLIKKNSGGQALGDAKFATVSPLIINSLISTQLPRLWFIVRILTESPFLWAYATRINKDLGIRTHVPTIRTKRGSTWHCYIQYRQARRAITPMLPEYSLRFLPNLGPTRILFYTPVPKSLVLFYSSSCAPSSS